MTKKTKLSIEEVKHVAKLANLTISDEEAEIYRRQLSGVLEIVDELQKIATPKIRPTTQVTGITNCLREDAVDTTRTFTQEEALRNAKKTYNGFFVVPKIL